MPTTSLLAGHDEAMSDSHATTPPLQARRFRRLGSVQASQLAEAMTWQTEAGDQLRGEAGDWLVTGDDGGQWTVRDAEFRSSYELAGAGSWQRTGTVMAWPAQAGEVVVTLEGSATAQAGDWIVQGSGGERWPVPAARFNRSYAPAD